MNPLESLKLDHDALALSDVLRATISIDALAPMTVTPPNPLLANPSRIAWSIAPDGPAVVTKLLDGQERWTQSYKLEPFVPGDAVPVEFAPFAVASGLQPAVNVTLPKKTVMVTTSVDASRLELRPLTGPEHPPPSPREEPSLLVPAALVLLAVALLVFVMVLRRRPQPAIDPKLSLQERFAGLTRVADSGRFADELSNLLRTSFDLSARTTGELASEPATSTVAGLLARCDAVKFAAADLAVAERERLLAEARAILL